MSRIIPNETSWIGFDTTVPTDIKAPKLADITAADDITCFVVNINASVQGNTVPVPELCSKFEKSVGGTVQASFTADFYRDDALNGDVAWDTLKRGTKGVFYISRFKQGFQAGDDPTPEVGDQLEVWPVEITSRTAGPMSSNTVQTFTVTAAVNIEPAEDATVAT